MAKDQSRSKNPWPKLRVLRETAEFTLNCGPGPLLRRPLAHDLALAHAPSLRTFVAIFVAAFVDHALRPGPPVPTTLRRRNGQRKIPDTKFLTTTLQQFALLCTNFAAGTQLERLTRSV